MFHEFPFIFRQSIPWIVLSLLCASAALGYWYYHQSDEKLVGLAYGNGRLEATEIDIATKLAGRLDSVAVHEGDDVERGQLVAALTLEELQAQLRGLRHKRSKLGKMLKPCEPVLPVPKASNI